MFFNKSNIGVFGFTVLASAAGFVYFFFNIRFSVFMNKIKITSWEVFNAKDIQTGCSEKCFSKNLYRYP